MGRIWKLPKHRYNTNVSVWATANQIKKNKEKSNENPYKTNTIEKIVAGGEADPYLLPQWEGH